MVKIVKKASQKQQKGNIIQPGNSQDNLACQTSIQQTILNLAILILITSTKQYSIWAKIYTIPQNGDGIKHLPNDILKQYIGNNLSIVRSDKSCWKQESMYTVNYSSEQTTHECLNFQVTCVYPCFSRLIHQNRDRQKDR